MKYLINTTYLSDSQKRNENVELSSSCPCCGVSLFPDLLYAVCVDHDDMEEDIVYTFNHCQNCDECFISKHPFDEENGDGFIYASSSPVKSCEQNFSEAITSLSPNFVSIYKQAALAESLGLEMFYKIAKTLSVTASITGILMMAGACSVKSQELFYLYAALGITTLTTGAFALEYFRILEWQYRKRKIREAREHARREAA